MPFLNTLPFRVPIHYVHVIVKASPHHGVLLALGSLGHVDCHKVKEFFRLHNAVAVIVGSAFQAAQQVTCKLSVASVWIFARGFVGARREKQHHPLGFVKRTLCGGDSVAVVAQAAGIASINKQQFVVGAAAFNDFGYLAITDAGRRPSCVVGAQSAFTAVSAEEEHHHVVGLRLCKDISQRCADALSCGIFPRQQCDVRCVCAVERRHVNCIILGLPQGVDVLVFGYAHRHHVDGAGRQQEGEQYAE